MGYGSEYWVGAIVPLSGKQGRGDFRAYDAARSGLPATGSSAGGKGFAQVFREYATNREFVQQIIRSVRTLRE